MTFLSVYKIGRIRHIDLAFERAGFRAVARQYGAGRTPWCTAGIQHTVPPLIERYDVQPPADASPLDTALCNVFRAEKKLEQAKFDHKNPGPDGVLLTIYAVKKCATELGRANKALYLLEQAQV